MQLQMPMQRGNAWDSRGSCGWGGATRLMWAWWMGWESPDLCVCCMADVPSDPVLPKGTALQQEPQLEHTNLCPDSCDNWDAASTALSHKENRIMWQIK